MAFFSIKRDTPTPFPSIQDLAQYDLSDRSTSAPVIWRVNLTFIVLVGVVVSLRIFTRAFITRHFFADDVLAVFAAIFTLVSASTALAATEYGLGMHVWNLPPPISNMVDMITHCVKLMFVAHVFYAVATAFTKLSIITSYLRIFPHETLRRIMYGTAVLVVGIGISAIFATIFQCLPVEAAWNFNITERKCFPFTDFLFANAAVSIATDLVLVAAPLPYFWSLNLPLRQRIVICVLFGVGFIAFVVSVVRIVSLRDMQGIDVTYYLVSPLNWTVIECSLGIICVSIPPMRPLFSKLAPGFVSTYISQGGTGVRTGGGSRLRSQPRTREDAVGDLDREMDRQLMNFEMADHRRQLSEKSDATVSVEASSVEHEPALPPLSYARKGDASPV
ncbi:hypothetical protein B0T24DRAFT_723232 [Lasiosphaeria ovina]|uniref:Rhodopsin domain-containing protein n=1 Tax=Lasiosphaeria ovina TaxID=92902 RepID=A0AAE0JWB2_9PEZI|nr:hypothetical protein B0T24DRAFT_723232 [Lasiosphaeria ovina]